jgi:hypothetical protein
MLFILAIKEEHRLDPQGDFRTGCYGECLDLRGRMELKLKKTVS